MPGGRPKKPETVLAEKIAHHLSQNAQIMRGATRMRYDGAGRGRRLAGWNPPNTSPNTAMANIELLRERSRDASRNDWAGASIVDKWGTHLVGVGITPRFNQFKGERKKTITRLWNNQVEVMDADGVLDFYGMQTLATRTWLDGGECFGRLRRRFPDEGLPVPMQVQLLEADMCPMLDADTYAGLPQTHIIRSGIEFDRRRQRVAYWFFKEHPNGADVSYTADKFVRVAASEVFHLFTPLRPGQIRGVSLLAPVLARLRIIGDYDDAVIERQRIANLFVAFITKGLPKLDGMGGVIDPTSPLDTAEAIELEGSLAPMAPGLFQELQEGEDVTFSNPPEAGTTYSDYMRTQNMGTAAAAHMPYEIFSGDLKDISDRTLRVAINEYQRMGLQRQWQNIIPQMCKPVMRWFANTAGLSGAIGLTEIEDVARPEWAPHGWAYLHPVQDVDGKVKQIEAGLVSRSAVVGERGDDIEQIDQERADDKAREDKLGLTPVVPDPAPPGDPAPNPAVQAMVRMQQKRDEDMAVLAALLS